MGRAARSEPHGISPDRVLLPLYMGLVWRLSHCNRTPSCKLAALATHEGLGFRQRIEARLDLLQGPFGS